MSSARTGTRQYFAWCVPADVCIVHAAWPMTWEIEYGGFPMVWMLYNIEHGDSIGILHNRHNFEHGDFIVVGRRFATR